MTGIPTELAARHLFDSLRALGRKPTSPGLARRDTKLIDSLERRLLEALARDRAGTATADGYPATTSGGFGGNRLTILVEDDRVTVTAVELAALALVEGSSPRDRHHELTRRAATALEDAVVALNTLTAALASIDDLTSDRGPTPRTCQHCTGKRGKGNDRTVAHRGTVGDRLERTMDLCEACWSFVRRVANPNSRAGYLPTDQQIRDHEERGRWKIKIA